MTTSTAKVTKKPPPRPAIYRRHSFDTCNLHVPPNVSPASSPPRPPEPAPKTPDKFCNTEVVSFPELTRKSSATRSRRHTMSNVDGGYAKYDRLSGKMKMMSPPPPPSRRRQSLRVGDVSGLPSLLLPSPPPLEMTEAEDSKKVEEKDTSNAPPQQHEIKVAANASCISSIVGTSKKFPAKMMPPRPPFQEDDDTEEPMEEDSSRQRQGGVSDGGNVRYGRRMSIGSILGPFVSGPPSDDDKKPTGGDSTTLPIPSLEGLHVSSPKSQRSPQGPSPRSSAIL